MANEPRSPAPWLETEPGWRLFSAELARLYRRSVARRWLTLSIAAVLALAVVAREMLRPIMFTSRAVMSVNEGRLDEGEFRGAKAQLRSYIADAVLNKQNVLALIDRHGLHSDLMELDPALAIDRVWEFLDIRVYQNHFVIEREDNRRSARIAVTYSSLDPDLAEAIVDDVTGLIVSFEAEKRQVEAKSAARDMLQAERKAEEDISNRSRQLAEKEFELGTGNAADPARLRVEILGLQRTLKTDQVRLQLFQDARAEVEFRASVESSNMALKFRLVDRQRPEPIYNRTPTLIVLGVVAFLFALIPAGMSIGAFDARIHDHGDVERLGLPVLGHVPRFDSIDAGSLKSRREKAEIVEGPS